MPVSDNISNLALHHIGKSVSIAIILSIAFIFVYIFINKKKHIFTKYHLSALILNICSLYLFCKITDDVINNEAFSRFDVFVNAKVVLLQNASFTKTMIFITNIVSPTVLFCLSVILVSILIYKKKGYCSFLLLLSMAGGLLFELATKLIIHRARPENALIEASGYSFPSGHATMAIIFFSLLIYSFRNSIKNSMLKKGFIALNILLFILIGFSRVYLNVHWLSDVLAGFSMGLFWLTFLILVFRVLISLTKRVAILLSR